MSHAEVPSALGEISETALRNQAEELLARGPHFAGAAQLLLKAAAERDDCCLETILSLVVASLCKGGAEVRSAMKYARKAVEMSEGAATDLQAKAQACLGCSLQTASRAPQVLPAHQSESSSKRALAALQTAVDLSPKTADFLYNLALVTAEQGAPHAALKYIRKALTTQQETAAPTWALLCLILSAQHQNELAIAAAEAGIGQVPTLQKALLLHIKSKLHMLEGQREEALQSLAQVRTMDQQGTSETWLQVGDLFLDLGKFKDAQYCLDKSCNTFGMTAEAFCLQAKIFECGMHWKAAVTACEEALARQPSCLQAILTLGRIYLKRANPNDLGIAWGYFSDVVRRDSLNAPAWHYIGLIAKKRGQMEVAEHYLKGSMILQQKQPVMPYSLLPWALYV